jgi:hypothetical protein
MSLLKRNAETGETRNKWNEGNPIILYRITEHLGSARLSRPSITRPLARNPGLDSKNEREVEDRTLIRA